MTVKELVKRVGKRAESVDDAPSWWVKMVDEVNVTVTAQLAAAAGDGDVADVPAPSPDAAVSDDEAAAEAPSSGRSAA